MVLRAAAVKQQRKFASGAAPRIGASTDKVTAKDRPGEYRNETAAKRGQDESRIHATAVVDGSAHIGRGVIIGPFCFVDQDVRIGDGCVLGPHVSILRHTTLGAGVTVHGGAVLGDVPQDREFSGEESYLRIGDRCTVREGATAHRGTKPKTTTVIGNGCMLMAFSHVAHNVVVGDNVTICNGALIAGYAEIGDQAFISGNCLVHQFVRIGRIAMLAGGSAISMDLPPFLMTPGMSGNQVLRPNVVGLRRAGYGSAERAQVKRAFDMVYRSGFIVSKAVEAIKTQCEGDLAIEFADFVSASRRGICRLFTPETTGHRSSAETARD